MQQVSGFGIGGLLCFEFSCLFWRYIVLEFGIFGFEDLTFFIVLVIVVCALLFMLSYWYGLPMFESGFVKCSAVRFGTCECTVCVADICTTFYWAVWFCSSAFLCV